jgi:hypothetical protein
MPHELQLVHVDVNKSGITVLANHVYDTISTFLVLSPRVFKEINSPIVRKCECVPRVPEVTRESDEMFPLRDNKLRHICWSAISESIPTF